MVIGEVVQGVPFDEVKPGNIFQFFDRDAKLHTAIKVSDELCNGVVFLTDLRRFRIFGQQDKLKADRSKGA
jgi:hypothetical protein